MKKRILHQVQMILEVMRDSEPVEKESQDEYVRKTSLEHTPPLHGEGVVPDNEGRSVLLSTLPEGRVSQPDEYLVVTTSVTVLHNTHTECAAMGVGDGDRVDDGGSGHDLMVADAILGRGEHNIPSGSLHTAVYGECSTLLPAPSPVRMDSLSNTEMREEDILKYHTDGEGGLITEPVSILNDGDNKMMGTGEHDETKCGDDEGGDGDMSGGVGDDSSVVGCKVRKGWCSTHDCDAKTIKVSSQKWRWKKKAKEYGYVSVKTSKIICSSKTRSKRPTVGNQGLCTAVQWRGIDIVNGGGQADLSVGTMAQK